MGVELDSLPKDGTGELGQANGNASFTTDRLDVKLLTRPEGWQAPTADHLETALRLLLVCGRREERAAVGLVLYHRLSEQAAAELAGTTCRRLAEVLKSVRLRVQMAEQRVWLETALGRINAPSVATNAASSGARGGKKQHARQRGAAGEQ